MIQRVTNASVKSDDLGIVRRHVEIGVFVHKFLEYMKDGGRYLLEERMSEKERDEAVEGNGSVDKFSKSGLDDERRLERLYSCKALEGVLGELGLLFERRFGGHFVIVRKADYDEKYWNHSP